MSTVPKPQQSAPQAPRPDAASAKSPKINKPQKEVVLLFDRENYMWMIGGLVLVFAGFLLMSGGKSPNPHEFNYDEIYSFRRITLAPIVILLGFAIEAYAIMKKPKDTTPNP